LETEKNTENVWKAEQKNKENVENQAYQISQERALEMLEELLEQDQFELLLPEYKLVYMMNDAVESFLVFHGARMTGIYQDDYEGPLDASVTYENGEYVLVVHQDDSVVTLFYQSLSVEVHLYNYGEIGHFWVEGYEYLRQLEYRIAILRDKLEYLGPEFCTPTEQKLAMLEQFPPLNYCCYPAVPDQYIVPKDNPWQPSEEAITVMEEILSPIALIISLEGPINVMPFCSHASTNSGFSDRNPYPGWIASTPAFSAILIIVSISRYASIGPLSGFRG
jgi:hypothetical protein